MKLLAGLLILSSFFSVGARAGGIGGGGGDAVGCNGGIFTVFTGDMNPIVSDLLTPNKNSFPHSYFNRLDHQIVLEAILKFLDQSNPAQGKEVREALRKITFTKVSKLESIDTGVKVNPLSKIFLGCSRKQIAIQDFNKPSSGLATVRLHKKRFESLYVFDQAVLKVHEAFIFIGHTKHSNLKSLEIEARSNVSVLFNSAGFNAFVIPDVIRQSGLEAKDLDANLVRLFRFFQANEGLIYSNANAQRMFEDLLDAGMNPNATVNCRMPILHSTLISGRSYAAGGDMPWSFATAALSLIGRNAQVDARDWYGRTPLHLAVMRGDETVNALLHAGADINATWCRRGRPAGEWAKTPLDIVSQREYIPPFSHVYAVYGELRELGAKTGEELGVKCPATPELTRAEKKSENCSQYGLMDWER
jgi:hypothetical protein